MTSYRVEQITGAQNGASAVEKNLLGELLNTLRYLISEQDLLSEQVGFFLSFITGKQGGTFLLLH